MPYFHRLKKEIGLRVLDKYNWKCSVCGTSKSLCVHHAERMGRKDEKYNDIENLIVVGRSCHMSLHQKAGHITIYTGGRTSWGKYAGERCGRRGKSNPPVKCKIEGCERWQHARGLRKKHYEYHRRRNWQEI